MKVKLTPLNILASLILVFYVWFAIVNVNKDWDKCLNGLCSILLASFLFVVIVADLVFRIFVKDLKRIWIVEISFIIFAAVLIVLFKWI